MAGGRCGGGACHELLWNFAGRWRVNLNSPRTMGSMRVRWVFLLVCVAAAAASSAAPSFAAQSPGSPSSGPYTLRVQSRVVLTDVTVTDSEGKPVRGLTARDFRIFDDGHAEAIASFQEHVEQQASQQAPSAEPGGVFSNAAVLHPPPVVNAILIDTTTIGLVDQMFLYQQLTRFVKQLPAGEPVAIFCRSGEFTLLLQSFTADHALLQAAIREAIPHFQSPEAPYVSGLDTLNQMAVYLAQIPGRKNILWFTGGSNLFLQNDPDNPAPPTIAPDMAARQEIYGLLESERIAIYPIDARGLTTDTSLAMQGQQMRMAEDAEATGGEAWYNTNGLAAAAQQIIAQDGDYYTLTYSPAGLNDSGRWHNVEVRVRGGRYQLSYRRGYYDLPRNTPPTGRTRTVLRANGQTMRVPNDRSQPIVFEARVTPVSARTVAVGAVGSVPRGEAPYAIRYEVPASALQASSVRDGQATFEIGCATLAFDRHGEPVVRQARKLVLSADEREIQAKPNGKLAFSQTVDLPRGRGYLYLLVWDGTSGRLGTINIPVDVQKRARAAR